MKIIISPSILACNFLEIGKELERLNASENLWIHLDVMDGHFVPNLTFGGAVLSLFQKVSKHPLDAHFMVTNPDKHIEWCKSAGLHNFTYHFEAVKDHKSIIREAKKYFPSVGISIKPGTLVNDVPEEIFDLIDLILVMSVEPGFGGQKFIPNAVDKVIQLDALRHKRKLNFMIQVDGGISDQNAGYLIQAGATNLVAGSYVFSAPNFDYESKIKKLR